MFKGYYISKHGILGEHCKLLCYGMKVFAAIITDTVYVEGTKHERGDFAIITHHTTTRLIVKR
jgi:hypothetical protein